MIPLLLLCLSGNVTATVTAEGDLVVTGDEQSNAIRLENEEGETWVSLCGLDGTTINGSPDDLILGLRYRRILIDMGEGDDDVWFYRVPLAMEHVIRLGPGDDWFGCDSSGNEYTYVDAGDGDDSVGGETASFGVLDVALGSGADSFELGWSEADGLRVDAGDGDDYVFIWASFLGPTRLVGGPGIDELEFRPFSHDPGGPPKVFGFELATLRGLR
jgi:hypothetical protein